ncbi:DUF4405 domain-containing protein [Polaribacter litorisediminis]|uniref:DUF4405 domain-containing protein n=1 Tax=Polaribacter litorisediminis TaxID=1908341 RepID=UPI001CC10707|nr:DUF4405 domain-containing protein [Polaribacter litorisediminis]UAM98209.1 DUF4405 domain-containing protein [Polaribacter litorisediminis]
MKKVVLNFSINATMAICMSFIFGTGMLIKYVLISGQERWIKYGSNVELYFLGLDRHEWGLVHFILGLVLIALLFVHIFLHRKIIKSVYKKLIKKSLTKKIVALLFLFFCLALIITSFFIEPKVELIKKGKGRQVLVYDGFDR